MDRIPASFIVQVKLSSKEEAKIHLLNSEDKLIFAEVFSVPCEMQVLF